MHKVPVHFLHFLQYVAILLINNCFKKAHVTVRYYINKQNTYFNYINIICIYLVLFLLTAPKK